MKAGDNLGGANEGKLFELNSEFLFSRRRKHSPARTRHAINPSLRPPLTSTAQLLSLCVTPSPPLQNQAAAAASLMFLLTLPSPESLNLQNQILCFHGCCTTRRINSDSSQIYVAIVKGWKVFYYVLNFSSLAPAWLWLKQVWTNCGP